MITTYIQSMRRCGYYNQRINTKAFWVCFAVNGLVTLAVSQVPVLNEVAMAAFFVLTLLMLAQRLNDCDRSKHWLWVFLLVPFLGPFIAACTTFVRSYPATNRFGPPQE